MFNRIHQKLGTAGFIISIVALVAALGGGAYAASGGLNGKQKKEVEKIAKKYAGKPGAAGVAGPAGPAGPAGAKGEPGAPGAPGTGSAGANGVSPVGTKFSGSSEGCTEGGVKFVGANTTVACNGVKGTTGFTETLPAKKTETGAWSISVGKESNAEFTLSFPIPLAAAIPAANVHYVESGGNGTSCPGSAEEPKATAGNLCMYQVFVSGTEEIGGISEAIIRPATTNPVGATEGASPSGALVFLPRKEEQTILGYGTWAVTAP